MDLYQQGHETLASDTAGTLVDIASIIDSLTDAEISESVSAKAEQSVFEGAKELAAHADKFLKLKPDSEFESAFNFLILTVFQQISTDSSLVLDELLPNLLSILSKPPPGSTVSVPAVLSVLSKMFNLLFSELNALSGEASDKTKLLIQQVFFTIATMAVEKGHYDALAMQLGQVDVWVKVWNVTDETAFYMKLADIIASADLNAAYKLNLKVASQSTDAAAVALRRGIQLPSQFDYDDLLALDTTQQVLNSGSAPEAAVLKMFLDAPEGKSAQDSIRSLAKEAKLPEDLLVRKLQLFVLANIASQHFAKNENVPYAVLAQALDVSEDEVEVYVIDAIRRDLVNGRLSQATSSFKVYRPSLHQFRQEHWQEVASKLDDWSVSLRNILSVLSQSTAGR
ncbi:hypothetical protein CANCADRAFT_141965 [Tortispora caseinolytica NRRL Y-17796]|uniref:PCI domain-containing protein n=1 Tax=Tortispora caseinolytica NRRL Y-17796 TaxID=767744 RepID=A0A1E4TD49_9ASCO|nr:hypothetical protein CANCADRAFT_141965 [Tortispora caseinolytica NRRL Y-17796]